MEQEDDLGRKAFKVDQASALGSLRVTAMKPQRTPEKKTFQKEKKKSKAERNVALGKQPSLTCTPMADSCQCMAKPIQYGKVKK